MKGNGNEKKSMNPMDKIKKIEQEREERRNRMEEAKK